MSHIAEETRVTGKVNPLAGRLQNESAWTATIAAVGKAAAMESRRHQDLARRDGDLTACVHSDGAFDAVVPFEPLRYLEVGY